MDRAEIIDYCLSFNLTYKDYPFDDTTLVIRHSSNKKIFALLGNKDFKDYISLKCDPMEADFLRSVYEAIVPGWHLNKKHWNTVYIDGDVGKEEMFRMIEHSYNLIKPKRSKISYE